MLEEIYEYHGCRTGDCPHETQEQCNRALFDLGALELKTRADKLANCLREAQDAPNYILAIVMMNKALAEWEEFLGEKK